MGFNDLTNEEIKKLFTRKKGTEPTPEVKEIAQKLLGLDQNTKNRIKDILKSENLSDDEIKKRFENMGSAWVIVVGS
jgi:hypothetical protein